MIYFIQSNDYVKVGYTSNIKNRHRKYVTENPEPIKIIGMCKGGFDVEKKIHKQLSDWHYRGEWFYLTEASRLKITEIIRENRDNIEPTKIKKVREKKTEKHKDTLDCLRQYRTSTGYIDITPQVRESISEELGVTLSTLSRHIGTLVKLRKLERIGSIYYLN